MPLRSWKTVNNFGHVSSGLYSGCSNKIHMRFGFGNLRPWTDSKCLDSKEKLFQFVVTCSCNTHTYITTQIRKQMLTEASISIQYSRHTSIEESRRVAKYLNLENIESFQPQSRSKYLLYTCSTITGLVVKSKDKWQRNSSKGVKQILQLVPNTILN